MSKMYHGGQWKISTATVAITEEKDLGIYVTSDLKPSRQCAQASQKAMSVGYDEKEFPKNRPNCT